MRRRIPLYLDELKAIPYNQEEVEFTVEAYPKAHPDQKKKSSKAATLVLKSDVQLRFTSLPQGKTPLSQLGIDAVRQTYEVSKGICWLFYMVVK
jgi:hypothetical protein